MNLTHLKFALEVMQSGSFTGAAKTCCVTQPTLSNGIQQLEAELGGRLFERTTRSVSLTPFGKHVLPAIQATLSAQSDLRDSAKSYFEPEYPVLVIGFSPLVDMRLVSALVDPFQAKNEQVTIRFKECFMDSLVGRLADGQVGLAIRPVQQADDADSIRVGTIPFYREPVYVVPRDGAAIRDFGSSALCVDDLENEIFVVTPDACGHANATRGWFKQRGKVLKEYAGQAVSYQIMQEWAELGLASAILPWSKISSENRAIARPLMLDAGRPAEISFELITIAGNKQAEPIETFVLHSRQIVSSMIEGLHIPDEQFAH